MKGGIYFHYICLIGILDSGNPEADFNSQQHLTILLGVFHNPAFIQCDTRYDICESIESGCFCFLHYGHLYSTCNDKLLLID